MKSPVLRPREYNQTLQAVARSKAKMFEFEVPIERHINVNEIPIDKMLDLTIGILGELTSRPEFLVDENKRELMFSAQYFNSLLSAKIVPENREILILLAASAYYLAGFPGSCKVLMSKSVLDQIDSALPLEKVLYGILNLKKIDLPSAAPSRREVVELIHQWNNYVESSGDFQGLDAALGPLRQTIYAIGGDEELLLIDVIQALIHRRREVSIGQVLIRYADSDIGLWNSYLEREDAVKEFWPAQIKLAENGLLRGRSAVVQMPTSAGKTRATEFIIRSSFLSGRAKTAIIVAPFRALCQEIYNEFTRSFRDDVEVRVSLVSDVLQNDDFDFLMNSHYSILILTPEKLDLLLKYSEDLSGQIGLIIYDEGHLFDSDKRGAKYELLLSSLKMKLRSDTQVVLLSAVIENAQGVLDWLVNAEGALIDGVGLNPTNRDVVFVQWDRGNANLQYVDEKTYRKSLFYVPTVLKSFELELRGRERSRRFYPVMQGSRPKEAGQVAGFLACRLSSAGLSAIFVGRKDSAEKITRELVDAYERGLPLPTPNQFVQNRVANQKVADYIAKTMGVESLSAKSAKIGVLIHHGGIPHGLRLVTEHALLHSHFAVVVCTSTLAQGVNLPIRYLIIASLYQSERPISTRDFHNLMGRAGRSGSYIEGTVIFADPEVYRLQGRIGSKWSLVDHVLRKENSEPSLSRLRLLVQEIDIDNEDMEDRYRIEITAIENELLAYLCSALVDVEALEDASQIAVSLAEATLGFTQLETEEEKNVYRGVFIRLAHEVCEKVPVRAHRSVYSKSMLGLDLASAFLDEIRDDFRYLALLVAYETEDANINILEMFWHYLYRYSKNRIVRLFSEVDAQRLCDLWISGAGFPEIFELASRFVMATSRSLKIGDIVDLCEQGYGYEMSALLGTFHELLSIILEEPMIFFEEKVKALQKFLKYGLRNQLEVSIYEIGFSDRNLCMQIREILGNEASSLSNRQIRRSIRDSSLIGSLIHEDYPDYFSKRFENLASGD